MPRRKVSGDDSAEIGRVAEIRRGEPNTTPRLLDFLKALTLGALSELSSLLLRGDTSGDGEEARGDAYRVELGVKPTEVWCGPSDVIVCDTRAEAEVESVATRCGGAYSALPSVDVDATAVDTDVE